MEEQYLPTVSVPVHSMEIFTTQWQSQTGNCWNCLFESMASQWQWRKWIEAAALERENIQEEFSYIKCTWHARENWSQGYRQVSAEPWNTQRLLSKWNSMDLFWHRLCGPAVGLQRRPGRNSTRRKGPAKGQMRSNTCQSTAKYHSCSSPSCSRSLSCTRFSHFLSPSLPLTSLSHYTLSFSFSQSASFLAPHPRTVTPLPPLPISSLSFPPPPLPPPSLSLPASVSSPLPPEPRSHSTLRPLRPSSILRCCSLL